MLWENIEIGERVRVRGDGEEKLEFKHFWGSRGIFEIERGALVSKEIT